MDEKTFEQLFSFYYTPLRNYAYSLLHDKDLSKEIVQRVFVNVWTIRNKIEIRNQVAAYLLRAVKNQSLNYLNERTRSLMVPIEGLSVDSVYHDPFEEEVGPDREDLKERIILGIEALPVQCRKIFVLSRFEKKKYREIAVELNISIKTVEAQIGIAYKKLRNSCRCSNAYV